MIPEDQHVSVCGIIGMSIVYELRKSFGICHGADAHVVFKALQLTSAHYAIDLIYGRRYDAVLPILASAGIYDDVNIIRKSCIGHLHQIVCCHSSLGLKVGSAHIYHYGNNILTFTEDCGISVSCLG